MASPSRKARGMRSQLVIAQWFQEHGFPHAQSTGAGRSGVDIIGMVGIAIEAKARTGFQPLAWLRQAAEYTHLGIPTVVFRPNGMGEQSVGQWGVLMRLEDYTRLIREAGYGSPEDVPQDGANGGHKAAEEGSHDDDLKDDEAPLAEGHPSALLDPQHARKVT